MSLTLSPDHLPSRAVSNTIVLEAVGNGGEMILGIDRLLPSVGAMGNVDKYGRHKGQYMIWATLGIVDNV